MISVKAFRQRSDDKKEKEPPWNTSKEASRRAKEELEKAKERTQREKSDVKVKAVRNTVAQAAWGSEVRRPLRQEVEDSASSSSEATSDEKEDIDAPVGGKEIQSEPQSRGRSLSPERSVRTESSVRLEPWRREKTVTTDKRIVPIKKDPITKLTKEDLRKSTQDLAKLRLEKRFKPMWMRNIPMTLEDFKNKEETWLGFHYALENIGLTYNGVKKRPSEGKEPWTDLEKTQRICQQAYMEHQMKVPKIPTRTNYTTKVEGYQARE